MAQANVPIQIKRSVSNTPATLNFGELAYKESGSALYVGNSTSGVVQLNVGGGVGGRGGNGFILIGAW